MVNRTIGESVNRKNTDTNADTDTCLISSKLLNPKLLTLNFLPSKH